MTGPPGACEDHGHHGRRRAAPVTTDEVTNGETTLHTVTDSRPGSAHHERLSVPWWAGPPVLLMAVLLAAELHLGHPGVLSWLPYLITVPLAVFALLSLGRVRVGVDGPDAPEPEIRAGEAHMPARFVGRVDIVTGTDKQRALGPDLDPQAFVVHRPWVGPVIRLEVLDPDDPTPYWVVSSRRPQRLLAALDAARPATR